MASEYPTGVDTFNEPSLPEFTSLSSAGTATRNHVEHHHDLGQAITALETYAAQRQHDHSGDAADPTKGPKLLQANTHQSADTDSGLVAIHHTLGTGAFQAAPGNHIHDYNTLTSRPRVLCTAATRPASPYLGLEIYETDTMATRTWMQPPGQVSPIWQLVPTTLIPRLIAESQDVQEVPQNTRHTCFFTHLIEALFFHRTNFLTNSTDIVVDEPGLYDVTAQIHWDPTRTRHDHSMIGITVNGLDIARNDWEYIRGFSFTPGFSQSNSINFKHRFAADDVIRLVTRHNGSTHSWLWFHHDNDDTPNQVNHLELTFLAP